MSLLYSRHYYEAYLISPDMIRGVILIEEVISMIHNLRIEFVSNIRREIRSLGKGEQIFGEILRIEHLLQIVDILLLVVFLILQGSIRVKELR